MQTIPLQIDAPVVLECDAWLWVAGEWGLPPGDVPVPLLQRTLVAAGANLGPEIATAVGARR